LALLSLLPLLQFRLARAHFSVGASSLCVPAFEFALCQAADAHQLACAIVRGLGCAGLGLRLDKRSLRRSDVAAGVPEVEVVEQSKRLARSHRLADGHFDGLDPPARRWTELRHSQVVKGNHAGCVHDPDKGFEVSLGEVQVHVVQSCRCHIDAVGGWLNCLGYRRRRCMGRLRCLAMPDLEPCHGGDQCGRSRQEYGPGVPHGTQP
jgi:hypothetical protein